MNCPASRSLCPSVEDLAELLEKGVSENRIKCKQDEGKLLAQGRLVSSAPVEREKLQWHSFEGKLK